MNISVVPTSHALCWLFVSQANAKDEDVHALNSANEHTCIWMHAPSLDAIMGQWPIQGFAIPGMMPISQSGALEMEMRVHPQPGMQLLHGWPKSGTVAWLFSVWTAACNVTHVVMDECWVLGYMRYRLAVVSVYALVERLMMIVSVTGGQRVHTAPRWNSWYSFTLC